MTFLAAIPALLLVAVAWATLAPRQIGGPLSYLIVYGNSMEPMFHADDLVVAHEQAVYGVGDIVAYENPQLRTVVLHRIIERNGSRWVFKGDNNDFIDSYEPRESQLVGRHWFFIPEAGRFLRMFTEPRSAALGAAVFGLFIVGGSGVARRRPGRHRAEADPLVLPRRSQSEAGGPAVKIVLAVALVLLAAFGAIAAISYTAPETSIGTTKVGYEHRGTFSYSAPQPEGDIYESDIESGDPVFLELIDAIEVDFNYRFASEAEHDIEGTARMDAELSAQNGWQRTFEVVEDTDLTGNSVRLTGTLDLEAPRDMIRRVERVSGVVGPGYTLTLRPTVAVDGSVQGAEITEDFDPKLEFVIDERQLRVAVPDEAEAESDPTAVFESTVPGTVAIASPRESRLALLGFGLPVRTARGVGLAGGLVALLICAMAGIALARAARRDEPTRIRGKYGSMLMPIRSIDMRDRPVIEMDCIEDIARLAQRFELPILNQSDIRYLVETDGTVYSYTPALEPRDEDAAEDADGLPREDVYV